MICFLEALEIREVSYLKGSTGCISNRLRDLKFWGSYSLVARRSGLDVHHDLQVTLAKSSQPLRTRAGIYLK
ncbi:MAG: hypothetical protein QOE55_7109 [Acidobacteriaceae bacterium]|nr:hypothetical protein [Acidobacteriaceae bacterium]